MEVKVYKKNKNIEKMSFKAKTLSAKLYSNESPYSADPVGMGPMICNPYRPDKSNCTDNKVAKII